LECNGGSRILLRDADKREEEEDGAQKNRDCKEELLDRLGFTVHEKLREYCFFRLFQQQRGVGVIESADDEKGASQKEKAEKERETGRYKIAARRFLGLPGGLVLRVHSGGV
jgi:hypothetical protein